MKNAVLLLLAALLATGCQAGIRRYDVKVIADYPHDASSYTQGLFFYDGSMMESAGMYSKSSFRVVDMVSGKVLRRMDFSPEYFVEGSAVLDGNLYILTWQEKVVFVYDARTLDYKAAYSYHREGWGLTTDGRHLIASDGSSRLYVMDSSLKVTRTIKVTLEGRPVRFLNELEYIDGKIWANVYGTDSIVVINYRTGEVESVIDCTGLLPDSLRTPETDVLNGIACDPSTGKIYLTGKNWPKLYEIALRRSN